MNNKDNISHTIIPYTLNLHSYGKEEIIVNQGKALQVVETSDTFVLLYQAYGEITPSRIEPNKSVLTIYNLKEKEDQIPLEFRNHNDSNTTITYLNSTYSAGEIHNWFVKYN